MRVISTPIGDLTAASKNRVHALWKERFGGSRSFVDFFLENAPRSTKVLFAEVDGVIEGMAFLFPCEFAAETAHIPIHYVYAMATSKAAENRGIATELLEYANAETSTVLVPADKSLIDFYAKRGYKPNMYVKAELFTDDNREAKPLKVADVSADEYFELREKSMTGNFVRWDKDAVKFAIEETLFHGGRAIRSVDGAWAALYKDYYGLVFAKEIVGRYDIETVGRGLARIEGAGRFNLRYNGEAGEWKYFGMSKGINSECGYLNLALD